MTGGGLVSGVVFVNSVLFLFGVGITALSFLAYRSSGGVRSFGFSTVGFGLVTLGGVTEPVYQLVVRGDYAISGAELLQLQTLEGVLMAAGFACLFASIYGYAPGSTRADAPSREDFEEFDS